jgi:hypothetical protein
MNIMGMNSKGSMLINVLRYEQKVCSSVHAHINRLIPFMNRLIYYNLAITRYIKTVQYRL